MTILQFADEVLLPDVELHKKPGTVKFYRDWLRHIEKFGSCPRLRSTWSRPRLARRGNTAWAINGEPCTLKRILRFAEEEGKDILADWMGHSSEWITSRFYIHITDRAKRVAFDSFRRIHREAPGRGSAAIERKGAVGKAANDEVP